MPRKIHTKPRCVNYIHMKHPDYFRCAKGNNIVKKGKCRTCCCYTAPKLSLKNLFKKFWRF